MGISSPELLPIVVALSQCARQRGCMLPHHVERCKWLALLGKIGSRSYRNNTGSGRVRGRVTFRTRIHDES